MRIIMARIMGGLVLGVLGRSSGLPKGRGGVEKGRVEAVSYGSCFGELTLPDTS
jgi:hypothetical protein